MKGIYQYIKESILDDDETLETKEFFKPETKEDLRKIIEDTIRKGNYKEGDTVDLNFINTSKIKNMCKLFSGINPHYHYGDELLEKYNYDISEWDVSNVTNMSDMFCGCKHLNLDLSKWKVKKVTTMVGMFMDSHFENDPQIGEWNVKNVKNLRWMFMGSNFNYDISNWQLHKLANLSNILHNTPIDKDLRKWNLRNYAIISSGVTQEQAQKCFGQYICKR